MIRILNAEPDQYSDEARRILRSIGELREQHLTRGQLMEELPAFDALIVRLAVQIDAEMIGRGRRLKVIASATTGLDHIDVDCARQRGISIISLNGERDFLATVPATAEHTWALLLALMRRIPQAFHSVCRGDWNRDACRGNDVRDKRLGIVGLGRVGGIVAGYARAFGMQVFAYDPCCAEAAAGVRMLQTLSGLLQVSDVLSIHAPLNRETRRLIGERELALLPRNAVVINTARGELLDGRALLDALQQGRLAGAALDVVPAERERQSAERDALIEYAGTHDNLLITPHIGGATRESMAKTEVFIAGKLKHHLMNTMMHEAS